MLLPACGPRVERVGQPFLATDDLADVLPHGRLRDEVDVRVRIRFPAFALQDPSGLSAAGRVAGARNRIAELAVRVLRILFHDPGAREPLLVAQLDATEVQ